MATVFQDQETSSTIYRGSMQEKNHSSAQYVKGTLLTQIQMEIHKRTNMEEKPMIHELLPIK